MNNQNPVGNDSNLLEHEADGIRELDNLLPRWWVWLFYLTIIFSVAYLGYYHVLKAGDSQAVEYQKEFDAGEKIKKVALEIFEDSIAKLEPSKDNSILAIGHQVFLTSCAPCHRADGGGLVGSNLTDDYWVHGSKFEDSLKVIWNGVPEKGMVTWKGMLTPGQIHAVASHIFTLRGTRPPNPKPPENIQVAPSGPSIYE